MIAAPESTADQATGDMKSQKTGLRVAIVGPDDFSLWQPRRGLIRYLLEQNCEVWAVSTPGDYVTKIESLGASHHQVDMARRFNPIDDLKFTFQLFRFFRRHRFDVVHNLTTKPNIFGVFAAWFARVKHIVMSVEGLGQVFGEAQGIKMKILKPALRKLYKLACAMATRTRFMNPDDEQFFVENKLVKPEKSILIVGEGVNLAEYSRDLLDGKAIESVRQRAGGSAGTKYVTMITRALWSKGVREFIEASKIVGERRDNVKFILIGPIDAGSNGVPKSYLDENETETFKYLGFVDDLRDAFAMSEVVVLPSYTREGVPNCLIEAMALGVPIVTTDNVGCRECVNDGETGYLVPVRDSKSLAEAIDKIVSNDELSRRFGEASRQKVEDDFNERRVFERLYNETYQ